MSVVSWISSSDLSDPTSGDAESAALAASHILYNLSGRKFNGRRTTTETYYCDNLELSDNSRLGQLAQDSLAFHTGTQLPVSMYRLAPAGGYNFIRLFGKTVRSVSSVVVGVTGTPEARVLDSSEYEVLDKQLLHPTPGASWSICDTVTVTYTYGSNPPEEGKRAAIELANQLLLSRCDPAACQLPKRVTSITRQGISIAILDPQDFLDKGRTGVYIVDLFLKSSNPTGALARPRVFTSDVKRPYTR